MTYLSNTANDPNDLGFFATPAALRAAYPVGIPGLFAIVGSTNTFWVWDQGTHAWVDTNQSPPIGPTGYTGYTGSTGYTGYTGSTGYTGYTGRTGYTGYTGYTGAGNFTGYTGYTGPIGPQGVTISVNQTSHGLSVGNVIRVSGANTYTKALADSAADAEAVGIVTTVVDVNNFIYTLYGYATTGVPSATAGTVFFWLR